MARMYLTLWKKIAANEAAVLTCHKSKEVTIRKAIYKEKWRDKLVKDATEQLSYGRLSITSTPVLDKPDYVRLTIILSYNGANL